jgi:carboxyl-terminal processing protease
MRHSLKNIVLIIFISASAAFLPFRADALTDKGYRALHNFTKVLNYIEGNYVSEVDEEKLIQGAIRGMVETLDPHSVYMSPEINRELKVDTSGRFDGIGIEVAVRHGSIVVISPIKNSPADKAGIQAGDRIVKINGEATKGMNLGEAVSKMRGRRASRVTLTISREGAKAPFDVTLTRQIINMPNVSAEAIGDDLAYISISSFQQGTARSLEKALKDLSKKAPLRGLVLDLRKNPGGLLEQAVAISDLFLESGTIVSTESRGKEIDRREALPDGDKPTYPIIVLVDGGSASASEIVAAALRDNGRAIIMGTNTFGKGSVQTVIDLDDGSGLKLTVANYKTPKGQLIQNEGIAPDIKVEAKPPEEMTEVKEGEEEKEPKELKERKPQIDYQKQAAIEELRKMAGEKGGNTL